MRFKLTLLVYELKNCIHMMERLSNCSCHKLAISVDIGKCEGGDSSGGFWRLVVYFCLHNCTSPSNDYAAVAYSNNNQAQLHTHVSVSLADLQTV